LSAYLPPTLMNPCSLPGSPRRWPAYCARRCHLDRLPRALQAAAPLLIPTGPRIDVSQALAPLLQACRRWRPIQRNGRKDTQKLHVEIVKTRTRRRIAKKAVLQRLSGCLRRSFVVRPSRAQVPGTIVVAGLFASGGYLLRYPSALAGSAAREPQQFSW
jgi:hypothetical protein